jgi:hypothetical protein
MKYFYPQINRNVGYFWNMLARINNEIGLEPTSSGDVGERTYLEFSRELTLSEKEKVDVIMASNPTLPPITNNTVFIIRDVWNQKSLIEGQMGFSYDVYYTESVPGSGDVNQVELHFKQNLTTQQRNKIISEYGKLITLR